MNFSHGLPRCVQFVTVQNFFKNSKREYLIKPFNITLRFK